MYQVIQPNRGLSLSLSLSLRGLCKVAEWKNSIKRNSHNLTLKWTPKWQSCSSRDRSGSSSGSRGSLRHNQRARATIANQMASKVKAADGTQQPRLQLAATCCNARARCIAKPVAVAARGVWGVWARQNARDHQLQLQLPQLHNAFAVTFCRLAPLGTVTQIDRQTDRQADEQTERQHIHSHTHTHSQATDKAHSQRSSRRRVDCLPFKASCALKSFVLGTQTKAKNLWRDDYYVIPTHTHIAIDTLSASCANLLRLLNYYIFSKGNSAYSSRISMRKRRLRQCPK